MIQHLDQKKELDDKKENVCMNKNKYFNKEIVVEP